MYYSSTTSSQVIRKNTESLQKILEAKKVHLRPDFEPWIPVDVDMEKAFRDKIFEKAGQRETPMLFIDDEFAGNYEKLMEMNEFGELDAIFDY
jgi:glutaredoxin-related protein